MADLKVGRTPLRDALHTLAHEGLVDIIPRRGTFVSPVTLGDLQQIFEVRLGIELMVGQAAVARVTDDDLKMLESLLRRSKASKADKESDVELDAEFHNLLLRIAANRYLSEIYRRVADASLRLMYLTDCGMEPPADQIHMLEGARGALTERDAEGLTAILRSHVEHFRDRVNNSLFK